MRWKHGAWLLFALAACNRAPQPGSAATAPPASTSTAAQAVASVDLADISERDPKYLIGISFPPELRHHPELAAEVKRDAEALRADFLRQAAANADSGTSAIFELSLAYSMVADTPRIVAVAAEGTSYVGGAHGAPLLERYVWLLPEHRRLTAAELIPDAANWKPVSDYVRDRLAAQQRQRLEEDAGAAAGDGASSDAAMKQQLKNAGDMIEQGTEPKAATFANFEPVLDAGGEIAALRFVFPPYQVGPYSDGTQRVDVPASVLLPYIAPGLRSLFAR